jgi:hypothetical protein
MDAVSRIDRIEVVALVCCFGLFGLILELVRRKKIKERYSLLWLGLTVSLFFLTIKRDWLTLLSNQLGIFYPPSALFLVLIFLVLFLSAPAPSLAVPASGPGGILIAAAPSGTA